MYNFYQSSQNTKNSQINNYIEYRKFKNPTVIRDQILRQYDQYHEIIDHDDRIKQLSLDRKKISDQIIHMYNKLHTSNNNSDDIVQINNMLQELDNDYKNITEKYHQILEESLSWIKTHFPQIYELITDRDPPLSRRTLEHVLDQFCMSESGQINRKKAIENGLDYMVKEYKLPTDFFDKSKINQFIGM